MGESEYTVYIRVPIPRGDFVDPPSVSDTLLASQVTKLIASRFNVPVDFILKQVAYLTERHTSQVRAQLLKATAAARGGNASTSTAVLRDAGEASSLQLGSSTRTGTASRQADHVLRKRLSSLPIDSTPQSPPAEVSPPSDNDQRLSPGPAESSSGSSEDESYPAQSRIIRRPPRYQQKASNVYDDEDDESEPAFQPYQPPAGGNDRSGQSMTSTLRDEVRPSGARRVGKAAQRPHHSQTSDSDTNLPTPARRPARSSEQRTPGPLSPRRTTELSGRSPIAKSREGSDGTPTLTSQLDASVTQSALEEALASHMGRPGSSSRFSISQAFRSRYNQGGN
ncbi:Autophagy-related protein-like protein [Emericellopsis cladophorae]|uniref:Autophagy-related protein 29 n=1 Tax=Emericellopsis cladophorae TaxID=2686198 RepID=A0A9Q0BHC4_9HYPO|nr:Autophagy-related protein-like protein [Emericellopsis cladophorae]KAI6784264.1 Autophagy-related protein-like protein [Emericellopsis cladophorae]